MHAFSSLSSIAIALLGAQATNAWLLEFWGTQNSCAKSGNTVADREAGGLSKEGNGCMMAYFDLEAMLVTDWDDGCTVRLYDGEDLNCRNEPFLEYSKEQAKEEGLMSDDGTYMCLTDLAGRMGPYYASYTC